MVFHLGVCSISLKKLDVARKHSDYDTPSLDVRMIIPYTLHTLSIKKNGSKDWVMVDPGGVIVEFFGFGAKKPHRG